MLNHKISQPASSFSTLARTICLSLLILVLGVGGQTVSAQDFEMPFNPVMENLTHPGNTDEVDIQDELRFAWVSNPSSQFAKNHPSIHRITCSKVKLLVQLELGAPHALAQLNTGNNPRELSVTFRLADFEHYLAALNIETYGKVFSSGTKGYVYFQDLQVETAKGTIEKLSISDRQRYIGFKMR